MQEDILEEFSINGLNEESNVHLKFVDNMKVIVSENGYGKTTIISLLYYFLNANKKLMSFNFKSLSIKLQGGGDNIYPKEIISVLFSDEFLDSFRIVSRRVDSKSAKNYNKRYNVKLTNSQVISLVIYFMCGQRNHPKGESIELKSLLNKLGGESDGIIPALMSIKKTVDDYSYFYESEKIKINFSDLYDGVQSICGQIYEVDDFSWNLIPFYEKLQDLLNVVEKLSKKEFIYLPTFRLVESNINAFKKDEDWDEEGLFSGLSETREFFKDNPLIQFGVDDIKETWSMLSNRIRSSTTQDFLKLSGRLLKNIVSNKKVEKKNVNYLLQNKDSILKILSRIDRETIDEKDKANLLSIIDKKEFEPKNNNNALFYILENMVIIYNNQKHIDETINKYKNVINDFFNDKSVIFDEITSEIYVEKKNGNKRVDIEKLSSGEKQILSLFTKIYLTELDDLNRKYWIFYDEPEISLSIEWQEILLPKILESNRCEFLMAATHSPFIFKNKLKSYTSDLALEVTEIV
ncbi:TPA: AAA family ATPase [Enterobacter bugandensis]